MYVNIYIYNNYLTLNKLSVWYGYVTLIKKSENVTFKIFNFFRL